MTTPAITETSRRSEVTFRFLIDNAGPRTIPYVRNAALYRPTALILKVVDGSHSGAPTLTGPRLRKSGGDGLQTYQEHLYSPLNYPAYVTAAIERAERAVRKTNKETA